MLGEFFIDKETDMNDFKEHLLAEQLEIEREVQIGNDLIEVNDKEIWINEDIFFEHTGINLKEAKDQEY